MLGLKNIAKIEIHDALQTRRWSWLLFFGSSRRRDRLCLGGVGVSFSSFPRHCPMISSAFRGRRKSNHHQMAASPYHRWKICRPRVLWKMKLASACYKQWKKPRNAIRVGVECLPYPSLDDVEGAVADKEEGSKLSRSSTTMSREGSQWTRSTLPYRGGTVTRISVHPSLVVMKRGSPDPIAWHARIPGFRTRAM